MKITSPMFLQAACSGRAKESIQLTFGIANPNILKISTSGAIMVESIYQGLPKKVEYNELSEAELAIQADANTLVTITGVVTALSVVSTTVSYTNLSKAISLKTLSLGNIAGLTTLDLSENIALTTVLLGIAGLTTLDLSENIALTSFASDGCTNLTSLDLSKNIALTSLTISNSGVSSLDITKQVELNTINSNVNNLADIKCRATSSGKGTGVARLITASTADGTVYVPSTDPYFSTIQTAATTKGWSVEELPTE